MYLNDISIKSFVLDLITVPVFSTPCPTTVGEFVLR